MQAKMLRCVGIYFLGCFVCVCVFLKEEFTGILFVLGVTRIFMRSQSSKPRMNHGPGFVVNFSSMS